MLPITIVDISLRTLYENKLLDMKLSTNQDRFTIIFVYPYSFIKKCLAEMIEMSNNKDAILKVGGDIKFVSPDSIQTCSSWIKSRFRKGVASDIKWPIMSDYNMKFVESLGLVTEEGVTKRAAFIFDKELKIRYFSFYDDAADKSVYELVRFLSELSIVDGYK